MHEWQALVHGMREHASSAALYGRSSVRLLARSRGRRRGQEERLVFVVGSPRSGTSFLARCLGSQPGFVDLGEVHPLKAAIPGLVGLDEDDAAARIHSVLERVRMLALARGLRGVEQTPEVAFVLGAALRAYPDARAVHIVRDGRDVVVSLLAKGWLNATESGGDDVGLAYGPHARFWVEPASVERFEEGSDAARAASAWQHYVRAARTAPERTFELRYERLVADPAGAAEQLAAHLDGDLESLTEAFRETRGDSVGRWERSLTAEQLEDVEAEAGPLLRELGYT